MASRFTTLSTKGQVILPAAVRRARQWPPGTRLEVQDTADGVLLKAVPAFAPTRIEDVAGSLKWHGPPVSIEEMDAAIGRAAANHDSSRTADTDD